MTKHDVIGSFYGQPVYQHIAPPYSDREFELETKMYGFSPSRISQLGGKSVAGYNIAKCICKSVIARGGQQMYQAAMNARLTGWEIYYSIEQVTK